MGKYFFRLCNDLNCTTVNENVSCWLNDDSRRHIWAEKKAFAITTLDVYKHMPLLIFNASVVFFLMHLIKENVSGRKGSFILSICLAFCQQEINIQMWSWTGSLAFSHQADTCTQVDPRVNLVPQWPSEPNAKHVSELDVITTAWYNIVLFSLTEEEKPIVAIHETYVTLFQKCNIWVTEWKRRPVYFNATSLSLENWWIHFCSHIRERLVKM